MIKYLRNMIDIHKGKPGYVIGLGPSLRDQLPYFESLDRDECCIISCNNVDIMTEINPHYWTLANNLPEFRVHNNSSRFNKLTKSCLTYCYRADGSDYSKNKPGIYDDQRLKIEEELLSIDFMPFYDSLTIPATCSNLSLPAVASMSLHEVYSEYVDGEISAPHKAEASLTTVAIHMLKLAIIAGCNPIYISGVDLDYTRGYVNNAPTKGRFESIARQQLGMHCMNRGNEREKTLKYFALINDQSKLRNIEIRSVIPDGHINSVFEYRNICDL